MSKKSAPLATAVGTAVLAAAGLSAMANAGENPFAVHELERGYSLTSSALEGGCGEGKCGEGQCGGNKAENSEHEGSHTASEEGGNVKALDLTTGEVETVTSESVEVDTVTSEGVEAQVESDASVVIESDETEKSSHEGKCGEGQCGG